MSSVGHLNLYYNFFLLMVEYQSSVVSFEEVEELLDPTFEQLLQTHVHQL
jgi:hypothetical protein